MLSEQLRVLIIDDEESYSRPLQHFLQQKYGFSADVVRNGSAALQRLALVQGQFDVALIDQSLLEGPNGIEVARTIKLRYPEIETIILTGWEMDDTKQAMEAAVFRYLKKSQTDPDEIALLVRGAAQHARFHTISHSILSEHDLNRLLEMIAAAARSLTAADDISIALLPRDGKEVRIYPKTDATWTEWKRHFRTQKLSVYIVQTGQSIQVLDTRTDERVAPELIASGIHAFVGVPIPSQEGNLGVLYAYSRSATGFDAWGTVTVLQTVAVQAGLAITNVQALAAQQVRAIEFEQLYSLGTELTASLELENVLEHVAHAARQFSGAERATVSVRIGHEAPYYFLQRGATINADCHPAIIVEPRPDGFTASRIFGQGKPFLIADLLAETNAHPTIVQQGVRSTIAVPIKFDGEVLGALYAHSNTPNRFCDDDIKRLQYLAYQSGGAIHNAQLHYEIKLERDLLAAMADQLRNIRGEKEPEKLQQEIVRLACELLNCDFGGLCRNRPAAQDLELLATWGFNPSSNPVLMPYGEGVIGTTAANAQAQRINDCISAEREKFLQNENVRALMAAPFLHGVEVEAVLFVGRRTADRRFEERDLDILRRFAEQAAVAWRTSQLMGIDRRRMLQLEILHQIGDYIQQDRDLEHIFHVALTGITAGFGLAFNRAALFLRDEDRRHLIGKMGIGELEMSKTQVAWEQNRELGLDKFKKYLQALEHDSLSQTQVEQNIRGLQLTCDPLSGNSFCQVLHTGRWLRLDTLEELQKLPVPFVDAFAPALPLAIIALRVRDKTIGLLIVDNKFTKAPITHEDIELLITFANTLSLAIDNTVLLQKTQAAEKDLRTLFVASNELLSALDSETILHNLVEQARRATSAASVSAVLINVQGQVQTIVTKGALQEVNLDEIIRSVGLSMEVILCGEPRKFENAELEMERINRSLLAHNIVAGLCLPLILEERAIGVIWYHYKEPRTFSEQQIDIYQLYANQAVLAWDIAQRIRRLQRLLDVNNQLVNTRSYEETLQQVADSARQALDADWTALWPYDVKEGVFLPNLACAVGVDETLWQQLCQQPQTTYSTAHPELKQDWIGVTDLTDRRRFGFIEESTHQLLTAAGVESFQALVLRAADTGRTPLGMLYANYRHRQEFGETQIVEAKLFARHAALVLQTIQSLDHVKRAYKSVQSVTDIVTFGENLDQTLKAIAEAMQKVLDCDIVTLYAYDQEKHELHSPPAMIGVHHPERVLQGGGVRPESVPHQVLEKDDLVWSMNAANDSLFSQGGFVQREGVKVVIGAPLRFGEHKVGIMFVNFRTPHSLDQDELDDVRLFANIAAAAINNAQRVEEMRRVRGYVGTTSAVEWMRMVSLSWGHTIRREVATALGRLTLLRMQLEKLQLADKFTGNLDILQKTLEGIGDVPIVAPLSAEDATESVNINDLLHAYLKGKRSMERYQGITFVEDLAPELDGRVTVRASRPWLRQSFEVLVDNAVYAMQQSQIVNKQISVSTRNVDSEIEISFRDSGPGIPAELGDRLFKQPIAKEVGSRGAGIGLLQAQAIVRTYGGDIDLRSTSPQGSDFVVTLPVEASAKE